MIPESFIQELLHRIDIVDLIDGYVPLRKAGANYAACCPFHNEKTPSFTVSPGKQFYHCFGCGAHGTSIGFLMEYSGLGFIEAIKELAGRVGMQVPDSEERPHSGPKLHTLTEIMSRAAKYYYEQLKRSDKAIAYLKKRGLSGEIAQKFGIGYAPDGWQNLAAAFDDYSISGLQEAGLVIKNEQGRLYDRFRDRVMFPIINQKGEVIAFGGRIMGEGEPKYLNSPETPLFEKGREVFGLPQARLSLREKNTAIVVEVTWMSWRWRSSESAMPLPRWGRQRRQRMSRNCCARWIGSFSALTAIRQDARLAGGRWKIVWRHYRNKKA